LKNDQKMLVFLSLEGCQSGLSYIFAKDVCPLNGTEGSNPSPSAVLKRSEKTAEGEQREALREGFEKRSGVPSQ
jgi:hypothetical protein